MIWPSPAKGSEALAGVSPDRAPESRVDPGEALQASTGAGGDLDSFLELGHRSTPFASVRWRAAIHAAKARSD